MSQDELTGWLTPSSPPVSADEPAALFCRSEASSEGGTRRVYRFSMKMWTAGCAPFIWWEEFKKLHGRRL